MSEPSDHRGTSGRADANSMAADDDPERDLGAQDEPTVRWNADAWRRFERDVPGESSGLNQVDPALAAVEDESAASVDERSMEGSSLPVDEAPAVEEGLHRELSGSHGYPPLDDGEGLDWIGRGAWALSGVMAAAAVLALAFWEPQDQTLGPQPAASSGLASKSIPKPTSVATQLADEPGLAGFDPAAPQAEDSADDVAAEPVVPTIVRLAEVTVASLGGMALRNGQELVPGAALREGDVIEVKGNLCLDLPPSSRLCAANGSVLRLRSLALEQRVIDVHKGRAVAVLRGQAEEASLTLRTDGLAAHVARGTFALASGAPDAVVRVHEGEAEVQAGEQAPRLLREGQAAAWTSGRLTLRKVWVGEATRDRLLARGPKAVAPRPAPVRGRGHSRGAPGPLQVQKGDAVAGDLQTQTASPAPGVEGALQEASPSVAAPPVDTARVDTATGQPDMAPPQALPEEGASAEPSTVEAEAELADGAEAPTPVEAMMRQAWQLLRDQKHAEAEALYEQIRRQFPGSREAQLVLVRLGDLRLAHLDDPLGAMGAYRTYLEEGGGSLVAEARLGLIRALRVLRRFAQERKAIDDYLTHHPGSPLVPELRERRALLGGS